MPSVSNGLLVLAKTSFSERISKGDIFWPNKTLISAIVTNWKQFKYFSLMIWYSTVAICSDHQHILILGLNLKFLPSFLPLNKSHYQWHRVFREKSERFFLTTPKTSLKMNQRKACQRTNLMVIQQTRPRRTPYRPASLAAPPVRLKRGRSLRRLCETENLFAAQPSSTEGGSWLLAIAFSNSIQRNIFSK